MAHLPPPGDLYQQALDPSSTQLFDSDEDGARNMLEMMMIRVAYRPIIVMADDAEQEIEVRCPAYPLIFELEQDHLGIELKCPPEGCGI